MFNNKGKYFPKRGELLLSGYSIGYIIGFGIPVCCTIYVIIFTLRKFLNVIKYTIFKNMKDK